MLDPDIFDLGIENLKKNFPDATFTEFKYQIWYNELSSQLSDEEFEAAICKAVFDLRQCPTGKELIELVKDSERELVSICWSRCLDVLSKRLSLDDLDDASLYAISQLGGLAYLGSLPNATLQGLNYDFKIHWQSFRKKPREFRRPAEPPTPPEYREYEPDEIEAELTPEQKAKNEWLKKQLEGLASANKSKRKSSNSTTNGHHN